MKKIIAFTFMVLFVSFFALAKEVEAPSSAPENSIMFDIARLNVKDKVKVENGSVAGLTVEIKFYDEGSWVTVGIASVNSNESVTLKTPYEDKLRKYKKNTWCLTFSSGINSDNYHLMITERHHDLIIQIFEK